MPNDRSNLELMLHSRAYPMQYASEFAEASITAVGDEVSPAIPTGVAATAIASGIRITWTLPTTNIDGTAMTDLRWHRIYYHTGAGIDISNPATYTDFKVVGPVDEYTDEPITAGTARYFVVTALDRTGNESPASSEVHATSGSVTPTTSIPDDATGLIFDDSVSGDGIVLGDGIIGIVFVTPDPAWANFDRYKLEYSEDGGAWTEIPNVPRTAYIHKSLDTTHAFKYRAYVVATDGTISTTPDVEDNATAGFTPNIADNDAVIAVLVLAEYIIATNEIRAPMIKAGTITGDKISAATTITAGTGNDVGVLDGADATYRIYAGHATPASAPFRVTKAGAVTCSNLTITGGTINLNGGVFQVDALGQVTCSNIQITGAGSTWAGAKIAQANIANLTTAIITSGTFAAVRIPNLSTDKLTTGTLLVGRTQAKCTDAAADQTSANTAAGIAGQGSLATRNTVNGTYIDDDSVTTGKLYIDDDIQFYQDGARHGCKGITDLYYSTSKSTSYPYIQINSGNLLLREHLTGSQLSLDAQVTLQSTANTQIIAATGIALSPGAGNAYGVTGAFKYINYQIHNGNAVTAWTEVDASAQVGSRRVLLLLRIENNGIGSMDVRFRPSDEAGEQDPNCHDWPGAFSTRVDDAQEVQWVWVLTGTSGRYDWDSDTNNSCFVNILGYFA